MLQLGHAGEGVEILHIFYLIGPLIRFNWATPVKAWRSDNGSGAAGWRVVLQLGHAGEGVEIVEAQLFPALDHDASIGPRR